MGRNGINMAIKFRVEKSRVREKENDLMLLKGSGILDPSCVTRKKKCYRDNRFHINESLGVLIFTKLKKKVRFYCPYLFP